MRQSFYVVRADDGTPMLATRPEPDTTAVDVVDDDPRPDVTALPLDDWHEDDGPVVWWKFPVEEPSWIGTPLDTNWPGYHTHWTPHPPIPSPHNEPLPSPSQEA